MGVMLNMDSYRGVHRARTRLAFCTDPALAAHLEYLRLAGYSDRTIYQRGRSLTLLAAVIRMPLLDASVYTLMEWRRSLRCGAEAIRHYVTDARRFYAWAVSAGLLAESPAREIPAPPPVRHLPRPISEQDLFRALENAPHRVRPWLVLAGWAGLRAKEIALLRRDRVLDHADPPVLVIADGATKGRRERIVPMSRFVLAEVTPYLPVRGWVFPRCDGRPGPNTPAVISHLANEWLHQAGITATLHQLRHRFATAAYGARRDLRLVQELMGHADPRTTAGYAANHQGDAARVVDALPVPRPLRIVRAAR